MRLSSKARRHLSWSFAILLGIGAGLYLLLGPDGYLTLLEHRAELRRLEAERDSLKETTRQLQERIKQLEDPTVMERLIRESDYAQPDEVIITLPDEPPPKDKKADQGPSGETGH